MSVIFELITNPLGLPVSPIWEWGILLIIGEIALRFAYTAVGVMNINNSGVNKILHWVIRFVIYIVIWFVLNRSISFVQFLIRLFK